MSLCILINVCLFTVRYYGGKKLGIPGLIKAYSKSAELVIKKNKLEDGKIDAFVNKKRSIRSWASRLPII